MAQQPASEVIQQAEEQPARRSGIPPVDLAGGLLGLAVFVVGVVIIAAVYVRASRMYEDIAPAINEAAVGSAPAAGAESGEAEIETGPVAARPDGRPLSKVVAEFGLRFLWLLLVASLGALIAAMGAKLAGAHRGKRT